MPGESVEYFLKLLKGSPSGPVFNPWWQVDRQNDIGSCAPGIRRKQLRAYLRNRMRKAPLAIIGEALGYRGGHFTGIPMTSERILLGRMNIAEVDSKHFLPGVTPRRTSKAEKCPGGLSEPTATIVWITLLQLGLSPEQFVLWNAFPWHSFNPHRGMLSNRTPTRREQPVGLPVLRAFLDLFSCDQVVALGRVAAVQLEELNVHARYVRHPASGGAKLFRQQIAKIVDKLT
jgi:uracil-DNA glycosylase